MKKSFSPMPAPNNEIDLNDIKYNLFASTKLDGIRCIFKDGEILSRSLKQIQNKQLREKFEPIRKFCEENNIIMDGEIYNHNLPFSLISSCVMTQDHNDKKAIKSWEEKCVEHDVNMTREEAVAGMKFWCFDSLKPDCLDTFVKRQEYILGFLNTHRNIMHQVSQCIVTSKQEVEKLFEEALDQGYEGLILKDPLGGYKFGRGTVKEGLIYKVKPYRTFDSQIIGIVQSTVVDPNAEKKTNELGRSVTSKKQEDRIAIDMASAFVVIYEGQEVKPVIAKTHEEKKEIWKNRDQYIGKWIQYKGMLVGAKDVPRHPVMEHFREDKD